MSRKKKRGGGQERGIKKEGSSVTIKRVETSKGKIAKKRYSGGGASRRLKWNFGAEQTWCKAR